MREILFRGKRINNGEWVEGGLIPLDVESGYVFIAKPYLSASTLPVYEIVKHYTHLVDPETVGQYTGLNVRGEKLFEGDIVKITDRYDNSVIYVVEFYMGGFSLKQKGVDYWAHFNDFHLRNYEFEILGNIHDNPELLKEGEE